MVSRNILLLCVCAFGCSGTDAAHDATAIDAAERGLDAQVEQDAQVERDAHVEQDAQSPDAEVGVDAAAPADATLGDDAASAADARVGDAATPVTTLSGLPFDTWSLVPMPGAVCGNGSTAPLGVNPHEGATELLVVISGGGLCWDLDSCFVRDLSIHVHEDYPTERFAPERSFAMGRVGWDNRSAPDNPFRNAHLVFVPYCTGDAHGGNAMRAYDPADATRIVHHRGGTNMQHFVDAMGATWPSLTSIRVVGRSSGGVGVQLNWGRFADRWPEADLALLADCGPLAAPDPARYAAWRSAWNLDTPPGCPTCTTTFAAYDDYFDARYPESRFALIATLRDATLRSLWNLPDFAPAMNTLVTEHLDGNETTRYFIVDSSAHGPMLDLAATLHAPDGTLLADWLQAWLSGDARWHNTRP